eukprot:144301-Chlamydomonas_euryale.AAC.1
MEDGLGQCWHDGFEGPEKLSAHATAIGVVMRVGAGWGRGGGDHRLVEGRRGEGKLMQCMCRSSSGTVPAPASSPFPPVTRSLTPDCARRCE